MGEAARAHVRLVLVVASTAARSSSHRRSMCGICQGELVIGAWFIN